MTQPVRRLANPWGFFAATYLASWLLWGLAAVSSPEGQPNLLLVVAGASVPSIMGIVFTYLTKDRAGRRDFWRRVVDVRRIGPRWWVVIVFLYPAVYAVVAIIYVLLGGALPTLTELLSRSAGPAILIELVVANFVISGLSEELGWRGYALDPLQGRWHALGASLILGLAHTLWHTPLFLIPGISQGEMGLLSLDYLLFLATGFAVAVIFTWVYNNTGRSILAAILLHGFHNLSLDFLSGLQGALPTGFNAVNAVVQLTLAAIVVVVWGADTLTGRARETSPGHVMSGLPKS